jgi:UDPglucose--hexose-1-phosphate uridylyltransferase
VDAPTRPGLRAFEFSLNGRDLFLQLPPYPYFNQHNIIIEKQHLPQLVTPDTIKDLVGLSKMLRVCVATNSDKEGTGCTNLEHKHYQAGNYPYAVFAAKPIKTFQHNGVQVQWLKYPCAGLKVIGGDGDKVIETGSALLTAWRNGSYPGLQDNLQTFCMICRFNGNDDDVAAHLKNQWELVIIPRNADPKFRTRQKLHCIKKEFVGIFEMAGYAILPGRLSTQLKQIADLLHQQEQGHTVSLGDLNIFQDWIDGWYTPVKNSPEAASWSTEQRVEQALKNCFLDILADNSPFAHDDANFTVPWIIQGGIKEQ